MRAEMDLIKDVRHKLQFRANSQLDTAGGGILSLSLSLHVALFLSRSVCLHVSVSLSLVFWKEVEAHVFVPVWESFNPSKETRLLP